MSATRYKKPHVDILICIEMTRERNLGIKKNTRYNDIQPCISYPFLNLLFEIFTSLGTHNKEPISLLYLLSIFLLLPYTITPLST